MYLSISSIICGAARLRYPLPAPAVQRFVGQAFQPDMSREASGWGLNLESNWLALIAVRLESLTYPIAARVASTMTGEPLASSARI